MKQARNAQSHDTDLAGRHRRKALRGNSLAHITKVATRALFRALQMRLTEGSVSLGHWIFLRILWESDGITQHDLSVAAGVTEPTAFSAVKAMEKLGYVKRKKMTNNKKMIYVFLTPKARLLKRKLVPLAEEVNRIAIEGLSPRDIMKLRRGLLTMVENLEREEEWPNRRFRTLSTRERARHVR